MRTLITCVLFGISIYFLLTWQEQQIIYSCEKAYFEGQKDAINKDVRIIKNNDSVYVWKKSCWDNGRTPKYNPTYLESSK